MLKPSDSRAMVYEVMSHHGLTPSLFHIFSHDPLMYRAPTNEIDPVDLHSDLIGIGYRVIVGASGLNVVLYENIDLGRLKLRRTKGGYVEASF